VLISRCAWHSRNHGYGKVLGVASWRGLRIDFTDGICHKCAARVAAPRRDFDGDPAPEPKAGHTSDVLVVALAVMTGLVLAAHPIHDAPPPSRAAGVPSRALAVAQAPALEPQDSAVRIRRAYAPRRPVGPARLRSVRDLQSP
jgi:hypothetical protein